MAVARALAVIAACTLLAACASGDSPPSSAAADTERPTSGAGDPSTPDAFPNATNTGVPRGTRLTTYSGDCTITDDDARIASMVVNCDLVIRAANVTIINSKINGRVELDTDAEGSQRWSYTLRDSEVDGGTAQQAAVGYGNMTVLRSNVHGGQASVQCGQRAVFCVVRDSWLHGQRIPAHADWHLGGFLSNGGTGVELTHNTVVCDARPTSVDGGCTGNINLFGDFAPVSRVTVVGNFLGANVGSAYCTYGGDVPSKKYPRADHVVYRDNVFERGENRRCAAYGPVTGFNPAGRGNKWTNNRWDDGGLVPPAN